ncbi:tripartite tricarboxylate transporter substrate binding protein [Piscinibacter sakaiensis]|uniref:tripartite tricarboxylate transporter substrate binding protein n=1 Tax=Piscinibacter sakaiensis TaxID=1547922 RepID=UPI003AABC2B7
MRTSIKLLGAMLLAAAGLAHADYPERTVTMVVPFPPGGVADTVARPVAEALGKELGQSVVVENRAGAGGATGIGVVGRAAPDGHTLLMSLSSISILPEADRILERKPQFTLDQFKPIARFTADPTVLVVRADSPWQNFAEFAADVGKNPGKYNYGSSGNYGTMHVPMEMLKNSARLRLVHIPYTGAGPAVVALLGGQVNALSTGPASVLAHIKAGKLRALAHWGDKPLASLPDVPSLKSLGHPVQFAQWSAMFVPAATPEPVVQKLRAAAKKVAMDPAVAQVINRAGSPIEYLDAPEFQAYWNTDAKTMTDAVRQIGRID